MKYLSIILGLLLSFPAFSQNIKGRIVSQEGNAIPAASVYIKENKQGLIANNEGEFQSKLSPGTYHLEIHCLGYESENREIKVNSEDIEISIELKKKDFQLKELEIRPKEDPANEIIRQAIKMAPYYQSVVKQMKYETYTKGSGKVTHIPALIETLSGQKEGIEMYKDKLFMQESFTEITFSAPNKYEQNVIAYSSTFPNMDDPKEAMIMGQASLYYPTYAGAISPLNPKAFDYYRFRYEGYDEEDGQFINKIRVIPKLKDGKLMEGIIYIADDEWNIRYAEITISETGVTQHTTINFHSVIDNVYLMTTFENNLSFNIFGIELTGNFLSSVQYKDIQLNDSLIAAQLEKNPPKKEKKKEKKSLEIKYEDRIKRTIDSLAVKRDSLYWSDVRTVVLNEEELKSYARKDTMQAYTDSLTNTSRNYKFKPSDLLWGGDLGNDSSLLYFHYSGLIWPLPEYNFVDGVWLGEDFQLDFKKHKNTGWQINPSVYWTFPRKSLIWKTDVLFDYDPIRLGQFRLSAGRTSEDFSGAEGMDRLINSVYSLLTGINHAKFYEKTYLNLSNQLDIANGLQLGLGYEFAKRMELSNHTNWNVFNIKNKELPNVPDYTGNLNGEYENLSKYTISLQYTPEYYYEIYKEKKYYVRSRFPRFELKYQQGLSAFTDKTSEFIRLELSIKQQIRLDIFSRLNYTVTAGKFFNNNDFNYIDYKHFDTSEQVVTFKNWNQSYVLLPYYTFSSNKQWIQAFVNYNTDYLLLKRLPFLQGKLFSETLQGKFLHTPNKKYYSEWGYSIDLPQNIGGVGVFVSFDSFNYNSFGMQVSVPLFRAKEDKSVVVSISF